MNTQDDANMLDIWVAGPSDTRGFGSKRLSVDEVANNMRDFLAKMQTVFTSVPEAFGRYALSEFTIAAEISGSGKLILLGSGVEANAKGAIEFKFVRK